MELALGQVLLHRLEKAHDKKDRAHRKAGRAKTALAPRSKSFVLPSLKLV